MAGEEKLKPRVHDTVAHKPTKLLGITIPQLPPSEIPITRPEEGALPLPSDYVWLGIKAALQKQADRLSSQTNGAPLLVVEPPPGIDADFGVAVHRLAPHFRKSPSEIAAELADNANANDKPPFVTEARAEGAFLNFKVDTESTGAAVLDQVETMGNRYGEQNLGNGAVVVIDCSSPNVAKHMSVGHLRSTVIGESLYRIYQAGGYTAIRDNHLGDWGTQFGMVGRAYELWKYEIPELQEDRNVVSGLYKLYVRINDAISDEKKTNPDQESSLEREGRAWFQRLEQGDPEARAMWEWTLSLSLAEFQRVYNLLGDQFEYQLGESQYIGMLPEVVQALQDNGVSHIDEKGRVAVDLKERKMPPLVVQKSDGTSLYATRDLATLVARTAWFSPNKILYVVGGDQNDYFRQVFAAFYKFAGNEAPMVEHVSFGMITLPEGRMSTRRGRVVFLEDVIQESIARARQKILESGRNLPEEQVDTIARQVGVGAVIYSDLGGRRERGIKFDIEQALSFEGNSAPYLQYAHARAHAILRKAEEAGITIEQTPDIALATPQERELIEQLGRFPEALVDAIVENQPNDVAVATYKTAELFNKFYNSTPVLSEQDPHLRNTRLRLTAASSQVIRNGLYLLGIEAPDVM